MEICACWAENDPKIVQVVLLTLQGETGKIETKLILTAMKKRSICERLSENRRLVRDGSEKQRKALWSSLSQRGLMQPVSVNEGGTAEEFLELSSLAYKRGMGALF